MEWRVFCSMGWSQETEVEGQIGWKLGSDVMSRSNHM